MGTSRLVLFCYFLLFCSLLCSSGCGIRNQFHSGRDLHYTINTTVSPEISAEGSLLPSPNN